MAFLSSALAFVVVLTALVFVHEMGHYLVARWRGVRVEVFSIGFGREIAGWTDRTGTRWKISWIPLGGYVKFVGDMNAASAGSAKALPPELAKDAFANKPLGSRAAVVVAGPVANFLFAIVVFATLYSTLGQPFTPPVISELEPGSVAEAAGFRAGDRFVRVDGVSIDRFEDLVQIVFASPGRMLDFTILRDGAQMTMRAAPGTREIAAKSGSKPQQVGYLGVRSSGYEQVRHNPAVSVWYATKQTWLVSRETLVSLGRMATGAGSSEDLRGPIGIAQLSGQVAHFGVAPLLEFMALLSISLGLLNLFPIPLLDGGHLLYYAFEFARGRPLGERAQEFGFRIGLALVLMLMLYATWNDFVQLDVVGRMRELF